jgi:hypothetical protein
VKVLVTVLVHSKKRIQSSFVLFQVYRHKKLSKHDSFCIIGDSEAYKRRWAGGEKKSTSFSSFLSFFFSLIPNIMINYLIINKLGTVLYQSAQVKKNNSNNNTGSINESQRIRYLPLLVIKDLIKANLNNTIQYIKIGNKTVVFKEVL